MSFSASLEDPRLRKAEEILRYCEVNDEQQQIKLESCRKGTLETSATADVIGAPV